MVNKKLIEHIVTGQGSDAASEIAKTLNKKLKSALEEQRTVTAQSVYGLRENEAMIAGLEGRITNIKRQIETSGDPGGQRRAALKKLENQLRTMRS